MNIFFFITFACLSLDNTSIITTFLLWQNLYYENIPIMTTPLLWQHRYYDNFMISPHSTGCYPFIWFGFHHWMPLEYSQFFIYIIIIHSALAGVRFPFLVCYNLRTLTPTNVLSCFQFSIHIKSLCKCYKGDGRASKNDLGLGCHILNVKSCRICEVEKLWSFYEIKVTVY